MRRKIVPPHPISMSSEWAPKQSSLSGPRLSGEKMRGSNLFSSYVTDASAAACVAQTALHPRMVCPWSSAQSSRIRSRNSRLLGPLRVQLLPRSFLRRQNFNLGCLIAAAPIGFPRFTILAAFRRRIRAPFGGST